MELDDARLFLNRELSWLAFNDRVLAEARETSLPVYERLKFLGIVASNLDEFFMIRVAGLKQQAQSAIPSSGPDGMSPSEQLAVISARTHAMVEEKYRIWRDELVPALAQSGTRILTASELTPEQRDAARAYFTAISPALTPLAVDPSHPFPHLRNKTINLAVMLRKEQKSRRGRRLRLGKDMHLAVVQLPAILGRLVSLPSTGRSFMMLGPLLSMYVGDLFPGYAVAQTAVFRVTRNWDLNVDEEESEDLLSSIQEELRRRDRGAAVRLEVDADAPRDLVSALADSLSLGAQDVYSIGGPHNLTDLNALADDDPRPELRLEPFTPAIPQELQDAEKLFPIIAKRDLLLHHPYESFDPVVRFLDEAADDPHVIAIKQTLYRTSFDSPIARALSRAAENGKQVAVLIELRARMDEANNIAWARRLEERGVHVAYGLVGLKTHCKMLLVVRREGTTIRRYLHLGTGNYNPQTARVYTDISYFTSRDEFADDASSVFNMLTGYSEPPRLKRLSVAPLDLETKIVELIQREAERAKKGEPARIVAKMNALAGPVVIRNLYAASQAGVDITLIVRGICCLRPGVPGVSDRIRVFSVVDRFLEHSRVFAFGTGDRTEVYLSSADWMPRNFVRRIETMWPILDPDLKARLLDETIGYALRDNVKSRELRSDGTYVRVEAHGAPHRSQKELLETAHRAHTPRPQTTFPRPFVVVG